MTKKWSTTQHAIFDIRDWKRGGRLEIQPDFQRRAVWSDAAKIMLMDTILRQIPMPKAFVASAIEEEKLYRTVIDGQQRISSILDFLDDKFSLEAPYDGPYKGLRYSELPQEARDAFIQYSIDFNEAIGFSEDELRETYLRLNKYAFALTKQELRRADFPGEFLRLAEHLSIHRFFEGSKIFTIAARRRFKDVEFVSELVAGLLDGPQEKQETLDSFYLRYSKWAPEEAQKVRERFTAVARDLAILFPPEAPISATRYKQKSDLYSLVIAIDELRTEGGSLEGVDAEPLRKDLHMLDHLIEPESKAPDCSEYAIKCVSQANTYWSRWWRMKFLKAFLAGTYLRKPPTEDGATLFYRLATGDHMPYGKPTVALCGGCNEATNRASEVVAWRNDSAVFQLSNACRLHAECLDRVNWIVLEGPASDASLTFRKIERQEVLI